ncbi:hypothetical protein F8S13_18405 [Chloroflexia bacterium SDU3-3]|nr:hypothetical protein F8S13_18405 [Chloroflexia bacterium SDU3-3]
MARTPMSTLALVALAFGICLFPIGWLSLYTPPLRFVTDIVFATDTAHAVGHTAMFAALGALVLGVWTALRRHPWRYAALLLCAGLAQEVLQLLYKQRPVGFDEFRDLGFDLLGIALAWLVVRALGRGHASAAWR